MPPINISSPNIGPGGLEVPQQAPGIQGRPQPQAPGGAPVLPRAPPSGHGGVNALRNGQLPPTAAFTPNVGGFVLPGQVPPQQGSAPSMTAAFTPNIGGFALPPQAGMSRPPPQAGIALSPQAFGRPPNLDKPLPPLPQGARPFAAAGQARPNLNKPLPALPQGAQPFAGTAQARPNLDKPLPPTPQGARPFAATGQPRPNLDKPLPRPPTGPQMSAGASRPGGDKPLPSLPQASLRVQTSASPPLRPNLSIPVGTQAGPSSQPRPATPSVTASPLPVAEEPAETSPAPQSDSPQAPATPTASSTSATQASVDMKAMFARMEQTLAEEEVKGEYSQRQLEALRGEMSERTKLEHKTDLWMNEQKSLRSSTTPQQQKELSLARDKIHAERGDKMGEEKLEAAGQRFLNEGAPMHKDLVVDLIDLAQEDADDKSLSPEVRQERTTLAANLQRALDAAMQTVK